ncbi:MAG: trypsin-like peptidase domain-containing protein, partial [Leptolyngbyaceae cyanobacterium SL_5_14]|nr:trypsin-like peptidase domain-containing protein [Leptolyngbyaceae cyanobacterium SL_5_14]
MPDLQDPRSFTVRILHLQQQTTVGTGFVISDDGLIATCAHVLEKAGVDPQTGKPYPKPLELIFGDVHGSSKDFLRDTLAEIPIYFQYAIEGRSQKATLFYSFVENEVSGYKDDVVILKLKGDTLPDGIKSAIIGAAEKSVGHSPNHSFRSFGYPKLPQYEGWPADGTIFDFAGERVDKTLRLPQVILISNDIAPGYSGAAVQDKDKNISKVIGIIVEVSTAEKAPLVGKSFAIDCSILQFCTKQLNLPSESSSILNTQISTYQRDSETVENFSDDEQIIPVAIQQKASTAKLLLSDAPAPVSKEIWVDRPTLLKNLSHDWENSQVLITGLIGLGGEGKSALVRQWIEHLTQSDLLQPDGVFWWSFSPQKGADQFLEALLNFLDPAIDPNHLFSSSQKLGKIN